MTCPSVFHRAVLRWAVLGLLTLAPAFALYAEVQLGLAKSAAKRGAKISAEVFPARPAPMILPVPAALVTHGEILWPFGVRGGGHPQGHPGFDFNTDVGAPVFATSRGRVRNITDEVEEGVTEKVVEIVDASFQTFYIGPMVNVSIAVGDFVEEGQKIAELGTFSNLPSPYGFIHWGVNSLSSQMAVCPYEFLTPTAKLELEGLHARSAYSEKTAFPLICNPCPSDGCR